MPTLEQVQTSMARALRGAENDVTLAAIADDGIGAGARLRIYRNHMLVTLTEALKANFPVLCRLVDDRFFDYAAHEYIAHALPEEPSLHAYGAGFGDFLAGFAALKDFPYLPDVGRFEHALTGALHAADAEAVPLSLLGGFGSEQAGDLVMCFHPSWRLLTSDWPVDRIWMAHQSEASLETLDAVTRGKTRLEIYRQHDRFVFRRLDAAEFTFRQALARGERLEEATDAALTADFLFDLPVALRTLFDERLIVHCGVALAPQSEEE